MHQPPSVIWMVSRTRVHTVLLLVLVVLVLSLQVAWWTSQAGDLGWRQLAGAGAAALACGLAWHHWQRVAVGTLGWDGHGWSWTGPSGSPEPGLPSVAIDLQVSMLIEFRPLGRARFWFWVAVADDPNHWKALRRAVFTRQAGGGSGGVPKEASATPQALP